MPGPDTDPLTRLRRGLGSDTQSATGDIASGAGDTAGNALQRLLAALGNGPGARLENLGETVLDAPTGLGNLAAAGIDKLPLIGGRGDDQRREQSAAAGAGQIAQAMQRLLMTVEDLRRAQPGNAPAPRKRELAR